MQEIQNFSGRSQESLALDGLAARVAAQLRLQTPQEIIYTELRKEGATDDELAEAFCHARRHSLRSAGVPTDERTAQLITTYQLIICRAFAQADLARAESAADKLHKIIMQQALRM